MLSSNVCCVTGLGEVASFACDRGTGGKQEKSERTGRGGANTGGKSKLRERASPLGTAKKRSFFSWQFKPPFAPPPSKTNIPFLPCLPDRVRGGTPQARREGTKKGKGELEVGRGKTRKPTKQQSKAPKGLRGRLGGRACDYPLQFSP